MAVIWPPRPQKLSLSTATHPTQNSRGLSARALLLPGALLLARLHSSLFLWPWPCPVCFPFSLLWAFPGAFGYSGVERSCRQFLYCSLHIPMSGTGHGVRFPFPVSPFFSSDLNCRYL